MGGQCILVSGKMRFSTKLRIIFYRKNKGREKNVVFRSSFTAICITLKTTSASYNKHDWLKSQTDEYEELTECFSVTSNRLDEQ